MMVRQQNQTLKYDTNCVYVQLFMYTSLTKGEQVIKLHRKARKEYLIRLCVMTSTTFIKISGIC